MGFTATTMLLIKLPTLVSAITEVQNFPDFHIGLECETAAGFVAVPPSGFEGGKVITVSGSSTRRLAWVAECA